jgi:glycosyltransferase involved in cell wall biosynthesis
MTIDPQNAPTVCFVGLANLPVLAREYGSHGVGGAELQQTLLARALAAQGYKVSMVVADYGQPDGAQWDGIKTYKAYRANAGIPVLRFIHPRWTSLWGAMKRARADIYYTSCAGALLGQVVLFARLHGVRVIFRIASNSDCDPRSLLIRYWRDKQLYRYGLRRVDLVLAQTPEQQQALLKNFRRTSRVVPSLTEANGRRQGFQERDIAALWVGNFRPLKRPELLLEAARKLPSQKFHIIGGPMPGSERYFEDVRSEALKLPNVCFHGPVPYHMIGEFYERARVFVGTSEIEGFPNTYLQAWARGTPVVAFLDPERLIARYGMGRAVTSVSELCEAIVAMTGDRQEWASASQRSRDYMDDRFNLTRMIAPYAQALSDLGYRCRSVLMVGTDLDGMGGVRAVVRGYVEGGLFERYDTVYVASHRAGSAWVKITTALKAWVRVAILLKKLDAPLVHVQTASRGSFWRKWLVCLMARAAGRPYLVHLHGGGFSRFYEHESGPLGKLLIRGTLAHASVVIALSEQWRERLLRICPTARVEVLPNAVAIPATVSSRRLEKREPALLFLGHLLRDKGVFDLVRAFARIAPRFPRMKLTLAGIGAIGEVQQLATQLGVRDRVLCPGWLGPEDKTAALATSTLFILPSYAEGMPMALLEAMSWGLPIIATPVGGIPQVVTNEVNGLLVSAGDVDALATALERMLENPALRTRVGDAARKTIEAGYSLDKALARLSGIYDRFGIQARATPKSSRAVVATAGELD